MMLSIANAFSSHFVDMGQKRQKGRQPKSAKNGPSGWDDEKFGLLMG